MTNEEKDLEYYKNNASEDYINTPISVLKYISKLEEHVEYEREKPSKQLKDISDEDAIKINDLLHITRKPEYKLNKSDKIRQGKNLAEALHYTNGSWMIAPGCILHIASYLQSKGYQLPIELDLPTKEKPLTEDDDLLYDLTDLPENKKQEFLVNMGNAISKNLVKSFLSLGLKTHIHQMIICNDVEYLLRFETVEFAKKNNYFKDLSKPLTVERLKDILEYNIPCCGMKEARIASELIHSEMQPKQVEVSEEILKETIIYYIKYFRLEDAFTDGNLYEIFCERNGRLIQSHLTKRLGLPTQKGISEDKWISVEDMLPDFYESVLTIDKNGGIRVLQLEEFAYQKRKAWCDVDILDKEHSNITHWQPLPKQPNNKP